MESDVDKLGGSKSVKTLLFRDETITEKLDIKFSRLLFNFYLVILNK